MPKQNHQNDKKQQTLAVKTAKAKYAASAKGKEIRKKSDQRPEAKAARLDRDRKKRAAKRQQKIQEDSIAARYCWLDQLGSSDTITTNTKAEKLKQQMTPKETE